MPALELFKPRNITSLPSDLISHVSSFLSLKSFLNLSKSCKSFYNLEIYSGRNYALIADEIVHLTNKMDYMTPEFVKIQQILINILKKTQNRLDFYITYHQHGMDIAGSLMHAFVLKRSLPLISLVISKDRSLLDSKDVCGWCPLHYACYEGFYPAFSLLIKNGVDVNMQDNEGETCLFVAARSGYIVLVKSLVENGADVAIVDNDGMSCADAARYDKKIEQYLLDNGAFLTEEVQDDDLDENLAYH